MGSDPEKKSKKKKEKKEKKAKKPDVEKEEQHQQEEVEETNEEAVVEEAQEEEDAAAENDQQEVEEADLEENENDDDEEGEEGSTTKRSSTKTKAVDDIGKKKKSDGVIGVWVGNLSFSTSEAALRKFLEPCGTIIRFVFPMKDETFNKGFAFAFFEKYESVVKARALSETLLNGRRLLIKDANTSPPKLGESVKEPPPPKSNVQVNEPSPTLFVGNLSFKCTPAILENVFKVYGPIRKARVATFEDTGRCKGFAYIDFESVSSATKAMGDPKKHYLDGRLIRMEYATEEATKKGGGGRFFGKKRKGQKDDNRGNNNHKKRKPNENGDGNKSEAPTISPLEMFQGQRVQFDDDDD